MSRIKVNQVVLSLQIVLESGEFSASNSFPLTLLSLFCRAARLFLPVGSFPIFPLLTLGPLNFPRTETVLTSVLTTRTLVAVTTCLAAVRTTMVRCRPQLPSYPVRTHSCECEDLNPPASAVVGTSGAVQRVNSRRRQPVSAQSAANSAYRQRGAIINTFIFSFAASQAAKRRNKAATHKATRLQRALQPLRRASSRGAITRERRNESIISDGYRAIRTCLSRRL